MDDARIMMQDIESALAQLAYRRTLAEASVEE
jgi:hypothetical protein